MAARRLADALALLVVDPRSFRELFILPSSRHGYPAANDGGQDMKLEPIVIATDESEAT